MYAGIDIGSQSTEAVLVTPHKEIAATVITRTGSNHVGLATEVLAEACKRAGCTVKDILCSVGTGYGRKNIPYVDYQITEITCHARGVNALYPEARTILEIGGQDSKVIKLGPDGTVVDFLMNEKCAAGTGRFFEIMADILNIGLHEFGQIGELSKNPIALSNLCAVFAESEVISKIAEGKKLEDIVKGINIAIGERMIAMIGKIQLEPQLVMTGGVAKNTGMVSAVESRLGVKVYVPEEPQITGALGAALIAREKYRKQGGAHE